LIRFGVKEGVDMEAYEREIWFKCNFCEKESYCEAEFNEVENAEVMCPYCKKMLKLDETRL
jgi:Zn finger protein HypA/HybF involved in hydrogenase expression